MSRSSAAPRLRQVILSKGEQRWLGIPSVELSPGGVLWATAYTGGPREPDEANRVVAITSTDLGRSWSPPRVVDDPPGSTRAYDACLWTDPAGRLHRFVNHADLVTRSFGVLDATHPDPDDAGRPFDPPRPLDLPVPFAFRMNKPVATSWGEWILPVTWAREAPGDWFPPAGAQLQGVAVSGDEGRTWGLHGAVVAPHWALENMVVERRDRTLWMLVRTGDRRLWESVSSDRGRTWSEGRPTAIVNPGSRFFVGRLRSGRLLLVNSPLADSRTSMVACLSDDDGATWTPPLVLDDRPAVSYPDACQAPDGTILAVHDRDRGGAGEVILSVFGEADVAG